MQTMTLNEYADWTHSMWVSFPSEAQQSDAKSLYIAALGLAGESGEIAALIHEARETYVWHPVQIAKELGDAFFYWNFLVKFFGYKPLDVVVPRLERSYTDANGREPIDSYEAFTRLMKHVGIIVEKVKKHLRDGTPVSGDVFLHNMWSAWRALEDIGAYFGLTVDEIIAANIAKLEDRKARGVRRGSGDNR